jgi:hypothetical protein
VKSVNHKELGEIIKELFNAKLPLYTWGAVGIGKSETVKETAKEIAKENGLDFSEDITSYKTKTLYYLDIRLSEFEPSDIRGLPKLTDKGTIWSLPEFLEFATTFASSHKDVFVFINFDELNLACPSIQAATYKLILDRKADSKPLADNCYILACGNRLEDKANVFELPAPLANRFCHIELKVPEMEDWVDWGLKHGVDERIIAFLKFKPSLLFHFDEKDREKSFPTPRTWNFCSRLIKNKETDKDFDMIETEISMTVGEPVAIQMAKFLKLTTKIKIMDFIEKPEKIKEITEIDMKYAITSELARVFKKNDKYFSNIMKVIENMKAEPEFAILTLRFLKEAKPAYFKEQAIKYAFIKDYAKYLL